MKKLLLLSLVVLSIMIAPLSNLYAEGSKTISFQGTLLDQDGNPLNDKLPVRFELFDAKYGGNQLWGETQSVQFESGYFNVYLGTENPLDLDFDQDYYLQITVADGTPYDRTKLSYSPYAFSSETAKLAELAQDIPDGSVTLVKLADEVKVITGDVEGTLPELYLADGAVKRNIKPGDIETWMLSENVSVPPSGPASGDLTGTYPDPKIADEAVTTRTINTGAVTWSKLQTPLNTTPGTILGWDGSKWVETDVPTWEVGRVKGVITDGGLEYNEDADGFLDLGIAEGGVVTSMIADKNVTYEKLQDPTNTTAGTIIGWDGTKWVDTDVPTWEIGRVKDVIVDRGLYREMDSTGFMNIGIDEDGIVSSMIKDGQVMTDDIADYNVTNVKLDTNAVTSVKIRDGEVYSADIADETIESGDIKNGEVMTEDLADGAVDLTKLNDGTDVGQVIYWDGTDWRYNDGTPHRSHVLKWDFNDDSTGMEMQWGQDGMSIPYYYGGLSTDENDEEVTMVTLEKNHGNPNAYDNVMELIVNDKDANSALLAIGSGVDSPNSTNDQVAGFYGNSDLGYKTGVVGVMADVTSLDLNDPDAYSVAGEFIHYTEGTDNGYTSVGLSGVSVVGEGTTGTHHVGVYGETDIEAGGGHAKGVIGEAKSDGADFNVGVHGTVTPANEFSVGIAGVNNAEWSFYDDYFGPGTRFENAESVGVLAYNADTTNNDMALFALSEGQAPAAGLVAEDSYAIEAMNSSADKQTIIGLNMSGPVISAMSFGSDIPVVMSVNNQGPAFSAGGNTDSSDYVAKIKNIGNGRGMLIESTSPTAFPYNWPGDPTDLDDATLVVKNNAAAPRIAIKTYGDIVANSTVYGSVFVANDSIIIGAPGNQVIIKAPENPGDPLVFDGDVDINGMLAVADSSSFGASIAVQEDVYVGDDIEVGDDVIAGGQVKAPTGDFVTLNVLDAINAGSATTVLGNTTTGTLTATDFFEAQNGASIDGGLLVDEIEVENGGTLSGAYDLDGNMLVQGSITPDGGTVTANAYDPNAVLTADEIYTNYIENTGDLVNQGTADIYNSTLVVGNTGPLGDGALVDGALIVTGESQLIGEVTTMANVVSPAAPTLDAHLTNRAYVDEMDSTYYAMVSADIDTILNIGATFAGQYDLTGDMKVQGSITPDGGTVTANAYDPNAVLTADEIYTNYIENTGDLVNQGTADIYNSTLVVGNTGPLGDGALVDGALIVTGESQLIGEVTTMANVVSPAAPTLDAHLTNRAYVDEMDSTYYAMVSADIDTILNIGATFAGDYDLTGTFELSNTFDVLAGGSITPDGGTVTANAYVSTADLTAQDIYARNGEFTGTLTADGSTSEFVSSPFGPGYVLSVSDDYDLLGTPGVTIDGDLLVTMNATGLMPPTLPVHLTNKAYVDLVVNDSVAAEAARRMAADAALQDSIDAEELARMNADAALQDSIDAEELARMNADAALQDSIDAEETARIAGDDAINTRIDSILYIGADLDGIYTLNGTVTSNGLIQPGTGDVVANKYVATADLTAANATLGGDLEVAGEAGIYGTPGDYVFNVTTDAGFGDPGVNIDGDFTSVGNVVMATNPGDMIQLVGPVNVPITNVTNPVDPTNDDHLANWGFVRNAISDSLGNLNADLPVTYNNSTHTIGLNYDATLELDGSNLSLNTDNANNWTATQAFDDVDINYGTIDSTVIGSASPAAATFTDVTTGSGTITSLVNGNLLVNDMGVVNNGQFLWAPLNPLTDKFRLLGEVEVVGANVTAAMMPTDDNHLTNMGYVKQAISDSLAQINATAPVTYNTATHTVGFNYDNTNFEVNLSDELDIMTGGITANEIATDAVDSDEIAADAVGSSEIAEDAVGNSELADDAVYTANIKDGEVKTDDISDGDVTNVKLNSDVFSSSHTWGGTQTFGNVDINGGSIDGTTIGNDVAAAATFTSVEATSLVFADANTVNEIVTEIGATPTDAQLPTAQAVDEAVNDALAGITATTPVTYDNVNFVIGLDYDESTLDTNLAGQLYVPAEGITSNEIADLTIVNGDIANSTIQNGKLANPSLTVNANAGLTTDLATIELGQTANLSVNTDGSTIEVNGSDNLAVVAEGITANEIGPNAVNNSELADNAVETSNIVDGNVTNKKLADSTVTIVPGTGLETTGDGVIALGETETFSVDFSDLASGLAGDGLVPDGDEIDINVGNTLVVADDTVGINLANENIWTANQTFPMAYATKFEADYLSTPNYDPGAGGANAGVRLGESNSTGWLNFRADGNDYVVASIGRDAPSADGLGIQFSDINNGNRRAGMGFNSATGEWNVGLMNNAADGDMIGFMADGSDDDMNLVVVKDNDLLNPTFSLDVDGNITAGTWDADIIDEGKIDDDIVRDNETPDVVNDINGSIAAGFTIQNNAVETAMIGNGEVTNAKLANDEVTITLGTGLQTDGDGELHLGDPAETFSVDFTATASALAGAGLVPNGTEIDVNVGNTLTVANDTVGINLGNANTWTAKQTFDEVDVNNGEIDGTVIGGNSEAEGTFSTLNATTKLNVKNSTETIVHAGNGVYDEGYIKTQKDGKTLVTLGSTNNGANGAVSVGTDDGAANWRASMFYADATMASSSPIEDNWVVGTGDLTAGEGVLLQYEATAATDEPRIAVYNTGFANNPFLVDEEGDVTANDITANTYAGTWAGDDIALGGQTSGNYIATLADDGNNTLTVNATPGESVAATIALNLNKANTWTADQTFPTAYAERFETTDGTFIIDESTDDVPWVNVYNDGTGNAVMELGYGTDGSMADAEYGISFNDAATGSLRAGMGYEMGSWQTGVGDLANQNGVLLNWTSNSADENRIMVADGDMMNPVFTVDSDGDLVTESLEFNTNTNEVNEIVTSISSPTDAQLPTAKAVDDAITSAASAVDMQGTYDAGSDVTLDNTEESISYTAGTTYTGSEMFDMSLTHNDVSSGDAPFSVADFTLDGDVIEDAGANVERAQANILGVLPDPLNGADKQVAAVTGGLVKNDGTPYSYGALGVQEDRGGSIQHYAAYLISDTEDADDAGLKVDQNYYGSAIDATTYDDGSSPASGTVSSTINATNKAEKGSAGSFTVDNTDNDEPSLVAQSFGDEGVGLKAVANGEQSTALEVIGNGVSVTDNPAMTVTHSDLTKGMAIHATNNSEAQTVFVQNDGEGNGLAVITENTTGRTANFTNNSADGGVAGFQNTDATNTTSAVSIEQDGSGAGLNIDAASNALTIEQGSIVLSNSSYDLSNLYTIDMTGENIDENIFVFTNAGDTGGSAENYTITNLPDGTSGQIIYIINADDDDTITTINGVTVNIAPNQAATLVFIDGSIDQWFIVD